MSHAMKSYFFKEKYENAAAVLGRKKYMSIWLKNKYLLAGKQRTWKKKKKKEEEKTRSNCYSILQKRRYLLQLNCISRSSSETLQLNTNMFTKGHREKKKTANVSLNDSTSVAYVLREP